MCYSARNLTEVPVSRFWSKASSCLPFLRFHLVLFVLVLLGVMIGCGGSGSSSSVTPPPPPPPSLTITSISNASPLPLTPVQISTSGLDVNAAVTVQLSDSAGYSVTEPAIRVASDGTVTAAVPLYVAKGTQTIGPGTVSVILQQGSNTSNSMSLSIQDLPPVSAYNVQPGQISHAMFQLQATLIGRRLNEFQAFQAATGNTVDTTQAQAHLGTMLNAAIQARSDIDRVTLDNTVVVPGGTLPDGSTIQFDQTTLDLMDRIQAVFLIGPFGNLVTQAPQAAQARKQHARVRKHLDRASQSISKELSFGGHFKAEFLPGVSTHRKKTRSSVHPDGSFSQDLTNVLATMEGINRVKEIVVATQDTNNAQTLLDSVKAIGEGVAVINELTTGDTNFGMVAAVMSTVNVTVHCWGDVGAWAIAEATGNQAAAALAVQDMASIPLNKELEALQTLALAPFDGPIVGGVSTVLNFGENAYKYLWPDSSGNTEANSDYQTQISVVNSDAPVFASSTQGLVEVTGTATITTNLGIEAPQSGIDLSPGPNGETISTVADPSGNYDMFVPIGVSGFDYTAANFNLFDPISNSVLSTDIVDLTGVSTNTVVQLPGLQGICNDDDAGAPDADDPDCD